MIIGKDLLECTGLKNSAINADDKFEVVTDSRKIQGENLFVSLFGPNFDSIDFIPDVFSKGVKKVILEGRTQNQEKIEKLKKDLGNENVLIVPDVFKFLLELGRIRSKRFQEEGGIVIGLTGSNGKTTNKEMLKHLLGALGLEKIWSTQGNLNNQIGVPLTLFKIEDNHKVAVVEMGTSLPGEIEILASCAIPQFGFITNIGHAHIEFLKSLEGVFEEKSALYRQIATRGDGLFLVNGFDDFLKKHKDKPNTFFLGEESLALLENGFSIKLKDRSYSIENENLLGDHQKINMAMCLTLVSRIYPELIDKFVEKAKNYSPPGMNRGEVVQSGNSSIYMDAYNANPNSMAASLASYKSYLNKKGKMTSSATFILGDMNELGDASEKLHQEIGKKLLEMEPAAAFFVGRFAPFYKSGFGDSALTFENVAKLKEYLNSLPNLPEELFVKGSRSLQLESILDITDR